MSNFSEPLNFSGLGDPFDDEIEDRFEDRFDDPYESVLEDPYDTWDHEDPFVEDDYFPGQDPEMVAVVTASGSMAYVYYEVQADFLYYERTGDYDFDYNELGEYEFDDWCLPDEAYCWHGDEAEYCVQCQIALYKEGQESDAAVGQPVLFSPAHAARLRQKAKSGDRRIHEKRIERRRERLNGFVNKTKPAKPKANEEPEVEEPKEIKSWWLHSRPLKSRVKQWLKPCDSRKGQKFAFDLEMLELI